MLRDAFEYLVGLGKPNTVKEHGRLYTDKSLSPVKEPQASPVVVRSLSGLVKYLKSDLDEQKRGKVMVHIEDPETVHVYTEVDSDVKRGEWIKAEASIPEFSFGRFYDTENFNIKLQSSFVKNDDQAVMLKVVGNIREENVKTTGDDGVSQTVTAKTGVASVGDAMVPNPVLVAPYRTFVEVDQPESDFIFRMQDGPKCALFEADGGAWKLEAMNNIDRYLKDHLSEQIEAGTVHIIS